MSYFVFTEENMDLSRIPNTYSYTEFRKLFSLISLIFYFRCRYLRYLLEIHDNCREDFESRS